MAGTISQAMLATVRDRVADPAGTRYLDAEIYAWLNEGLQAIAHAVADEAMTPLTSVDSTALVTSQNNYDLPSDFMRERLVKLIGVVSRRWQQREWDALSHNSMIVASASNPFHYIVDDDIRFHAGSITQSGTDTCEMWYVKSPTTISGTVDPDLPAPFYNLAEDWAVARCFENARRWDLASIAMAHFREQCVLVNSVWNGSGIFDGIPNDPEFSVLRGE